MTSGHSRYVCFEAPGRVAVREEELPVPGDDQVLVRTLRSLVSAGTEMLVYRGEFPEDLPVDSTLPGMKRRFSYPLKYGYSAVGEVVSAGKSVRGIAAGQRVFAFQPHQEYFVSAPEDLIPLPGGMDPEDGVFLANLETAVGLVQDGAPLAGEEVLVLGQGVVGLLTAALLAGFPLGRLVVADRLANRIEHARRMGVERCVQLDGGKTAGEMLRREFADPARGPDLIFELSGSPAALNLALEVAGLETRIVVGSWYGKKPVSLDLGRNFHRNRVRILSSQVSHLSAPLLARWDKSRRLQFAVELLAQKRVQPSLLITHRFPLAQAPEVYRQIGRGGEQVPLAAVFVYSESE